MRIFPGPKSSIRQEPSVLVIHTVDKELHIKRTFYMKYKYLLALEMMQAPKSVNVLV